jgi:hypothetical protein
MNILLRPFSCDKNWQVLIKWLSQPPRCIIELSIKLAQAYVYSHNHSSRAWRASLPAAASDSPFQVRRTSGIQLAYRLAPVITSFAYTDRHLEQLNNKAIHPDTTIFLIHVFIVTFLYPPRIKRSVVSQRKTATGKQNSVSFCDYFDPRKRPTCCLIWQAASQRERVQLCQNHMQAKNWIATSHQAVQLLLM